MRSGASRWRCSTSSTAIGCSPREAYRQTFDALLSSGSERDACRTMVALLALAHDRGCEAELAGCLADGL